MTLVELVIALHTVGCQLIPAGEHLRVQDPQHALTDDVRQAIREHKPELLRLLAQTTPARTSPLAEASVFRPSTGLDPSSQHSENLETYSLAWRFWVRPGTCYACGTMRRWRSISGVLICARCHPPADAALVTTWEGEER